jgi:hypothetical protein
LKDKDEGNNETQTTKVATAMWQLQRGNGEALTADQPQDDASTRTEVHGTNHPERAHIIDQIPPEPGTLARERRRPQVGTAFVRGTGTAHAQSITCG